MTEVLRVEDLSVTYHSPSGPVFAVGGVSFALQAEQSLGILGETGCGKSTTIRAITGMLSPGATVVSGRVLFRGTDLLATSRRHLREVRGRHIAFLPQNAVAALNPVVTIERQFRTLSRIVNKGISAAAARDQAADLLRRVGLRDPRRVLGSRSFELSGGMAQRVVMAMVLIRDPEVIVADEPTSGLDVTVLRQVMELLASIQAERRTAIIVVTHDVGVVAQYCDSTVVMYGGRIVEEGPVSKVLVSPRHRYTSGLLGALPTRGQPLRPIPGTVPSFHSAHRCCPFVDRCDAPLDQCRAEVPALRLVSEEHHVACLNPSLPLGPSLQPVEAPAQAGEPLRT